MNKEYIIKDSVTTLAIAIAEHQLIPNENNVDTCLDKVYKVLKPQWMKNQVIFNYIYIYIFIIGIIIKAKLFGLSLKKKNYN